MKVARLIEWRVDPHESQVDSIPIKCVDVEEAERVAKVLNTRELSVAVEPPE